MEAKDILCPVQNMFDELELRFQSVGSGMKEKMRVGGGSLW